MTHKQHFTPLARALALALSLASAAALAQSAPGVGGFDTADIGGGGTVMTGKLPVLPAPAGADCANALALAKERASASARASVRFSSMSCLRSGEAQVPHL